MCHLCAAPPPFAFSQTTGQTSPTFYGAGENGSWGEVTELLTSNRTPTTEQSEHSIQVQLSQPVPYGTKVKGSLEEPE